MEIKGKRVLVTGGAVRIGRALCEAFAKAGAQVVIHCNTSMVEAEKLRKKLSGFGHQVVQCDLSSPSETASLFEQCGKIDILVNNASIYRLGHFFDEDEAQVREQLQVNFLSPVSLMKQLAAQDIDEGCIINFLDQEVAKSTETLNSYALSKRSLRDATLTAARDGAPRIRVNAIAPGPVLPPVGLNAPGMQKVLNKVPMGKQIPLEDIISACFFLIQNNSLTGQIIYVDGGQHLA